MVISVTKKCIRHQIAYRTAIPYGARSEHDDTKPFQNQEWDEKVSRDVSFDVLNENEASSNVLLVLPTQNITMGCLI